MAVANALAFYDTATILMAKKGLGWGKIGGGGGGNVEKQRLCLVAY
jgi:hypothetical protein